MVLTDLRFIGLQNLEIQLFQVSAYAQHASSEIIYNNLQLCSVTDKLKLQLLNSTVFKPLMLTK